MEVRPISANQPSSKGYVHKSLKKYINDIIATEQCNLIDSARKAEQSVDLERVTGIKTRGRRILQKLNSLVKPLHKNTCIDINKSGFLKISNPISQKPITVYRSCYTREPVWDFNWASVWIHSNDCEYVDIQKPNMKHLDVIEKDVDEMEARITRSKIENAILNMAEKDLEDDVVNSKKAGIFEKLKIKLKEISIDGYIKKTGLVTDKKG